MGFDIINTLKKEKGMTNAQIARLSGVTLSTLDKITSGINKNPKLDTLQAICNVLGCTLNDFMDRPPQPQKASPYSDEAMKLAGDYDSHMDDRGRETVRGVADLEIARYKEAIQKQQVQLEAMKKPEVAEEAIYILPYYLHPSSAGTGEYSDGDEWEELTLCKRPPRGASYVVRVHGDSMEPTYRDGDRVFVRAGADVRPGQIGIFIMDGEQYIKELGDGVLISHNPGYSSHPMTANIRCQGLVLGVCDAEYCIGRRSG